MILILALCFILTFVGDACNELDLLCSSELLQLVDIAAALRLFRHRRQLCSSSTDIIFLLMRCTCLVAHTIVVGIVQIFPKQSIVLQAMRSPIKIQFCLPEDIA